MTLITSRSAASLILGRARKQTARHPVRARLEQGRIMLNPTSGRLRNAALTVAFAALAGCSGPTPAPPPVAPLDAAQAAARTQVPLTRPVALDKPGVIADMEFDLPPHSSTAAPRLMIGLRIQDKDVGRLMEYSDVVVREGLPAQVRLERLVDRSLGDVVLVRTSRDMRQDMPVAGDGRVPGVTTSSVDDGMLRGAGLIDDQLHYQELKFVHADGLSTGRYRLTIRLEEDRPTLRTRPAELLVAYSYLAK
ncbi:hypothetical protein ABE522_08795 [Stenotrophomonas pennii]|uniref:hypothetical protein n=1 Tax=Stenotrophomonas lacuserhaii TaxID=2760084 RepID=UPI00320A4FDE